VPPAPDRPLNAFRRRLWVGAGLVCVGLGVVGAILPLMPSTVFFIAAAACFSRSSPRLHAWLLRLPVAGPLVRDDQAGLGMPRRAKWAASVMIAVAVATSAWRFIPSAAGQAGWALVGAAGVAFIWVRVPSREARPLAGEAD
jgi:uncharacterized membrane protein YbaN (DUF454 family)